MLTLENVHKSYGRLKAVDGVSLTVPRGQIVGLIGPNGSGKSTLLSVASGAQHADAGRIEFDGHDIGQMRVDAIYRLGLVRSYQDPSLFFRMSVLDNMLLPAKGQIGERPARAPWRRFWQRQEADEAQAAARVLADTQLSGQITGSASDLSGGQMKLLELSRSLMGDPKLLLLDEPTAGVAPALAYAIFERIADLRQRLGLTFLIVEHRLDILFDFVDSVYVMHAGRLIAAGKPADIQADKLVREVYYGE